MASIIRTDALQNLNTSNIITQTNATTLTIGASGQTISIPAGATLTNNGTASGFGLTWQSVQTTGFTAVKGNAYPCNTTSAAFTVTLPATPAAGDQIQLVDYAGTFDTNAITINPNGNKIQGGTANLLLAGEREGVILTYIDSTQGWLATSGINEGTNALEPSTYSADFLVIAGGGGAASGYGNGNGVGGGGAGGYRSSNSTYGSSGGGGSAESSLTFDKGIVYTITVGAGGSGGTLNTAPSAGGQSGTSGSNSSISGTGITTITSIGGGFSVNCCTASASGGSGGGSSDSGAGSGTANQGFAGGNFNGASIYQGGGGGGSGAVGANGNAAGTGPNGTGAGGAGTSSTITGTGVTRAGGGGGGRYQGSSTGTGGTGGGGAGGSGTNPATAGGAGTVNTGGGGGGGGSPNPGITGSNGGNGGKGVVILRMPTNKYSGTTTGSPTVTTSGTDTILTFNDSGSYTG